METDGERDESVDATSGETDSAVDDEDGTDEPEPAVQSAALRRQQLFVGSGVAAIAGAAAVVIGAQQFPGLPFYAYLAVGMATTGVLFALLFFSVFRGGD